MIFHSALSLVASQSTCGGSTKSPLGKGSLISAVYRISVCCAAICRFAACLGALLSCFGTLLAEDFRDCAMCEVSSYASYALEAESAKADVMQGYMIAVMVRTCERTAALQVKAAVGAQTK